MAGAMRRSRDGPTRADRPPLCRPCGRTDRLSTTLATRASLQGERSTAAPRRTSGLGLTLWTAAHCLCRERRERGDASAAPMRTRRISPRSAKLTTAVAVTTRWSSTCTSTSCSADFRDSVRNSSARLGSFPTAKRWQVPTRSPIEHARGHRRTLHAPMESPRQRCRCGAKAVREQDDGAAR